MISQFFILSARGDTIINRDYRHDLIKTTPEIFFRNVKLHTGDAPPIFNIDGISYAYMKKSSGLFIVATTRGNMSPSFLMDVLNRVVKTLKDFCGVVTEESIRKNFVLIYEVLDELLDFGYPQLTSTEQIKSLIVSEPVLVKELQNPFTPSIFKRDKIAPKASQRPVGKKNFQGDEIFVDVIERLTMLFNASGYVINSSIEGYIQMKSYLTGNPELKLALNEDLTVGRGSYGSGTVVLDDCNFNECVDITNFQSSRVLKIKPPEGEFVAMNYRINNSDFAAPFRIFPYIDEISNYKLELELRIRACYPKTVNASYLFVKVPLPKGNSSIHPELMKGATNQVVDYKEKENLVEWKIKGFKGGEEHTLRVKISLQTSQNVHNSKKEIGPITLNFEIPQFNTSNLQLKYLRVDEGYKNQKIQRWVRFLTQAASYVCRTT